MNSLLLFVCLQSAALKFLGSAESVAAIVSEALRLIKFKLPSIQQSMQLYLANRETECILFRPIKNNVVAAFTQLLQLISQHYTGDELMLIACPLPEQITLMLSSTSLSHQNSGLEVSEQPEKSKDDQKEEPKTSSEEPSTADYKETETKSLNSPKGVDIV